MDQRVKLAKQLKRMRGGKVKTRNVSWFWPETECSNHEQAEKMVVHLGRPNQ